MDELDARLRAMAKREDWALPAAYESAMDGLEEQIRQGGATISHACCVREMAVTHWSTPADSPL